MKKIVIFNFSGTGNTWWVSECIADTLKSLGIKAYALSIEQVRVEAASTMITEADAVGFGYNKLRYEIFDKFFSMLDKAQFTLHFVMCNVLKNIQ